MPKFYIDVEQRSEEWQMLRLGIPTASEFKRIVTPKGKLSTQAEGYMDELLAEWMYGAPLAEFDVRTQWMDRGEAFESQARQAYEFLVDQPVLLCGLITSDDGMIGASPDGLVGDSRILELKCPKPSTHAHYMRTRSVEDEYAPQLQGLLWVCERDRVDIMSYCPPFREVKVEVGRDDKYISTLKDALSAFVETLIAAREAMVKEYGPPGHMHDQEQPQPQPVMSDDAFDAFCRPVV